MVNVSRGQLMQGDLMDNTRFDDVTRALSPLLTRRGLAGLLGIAALGATEVADAKKKRRKRRKKKGGDHNTPTPVVKFNAFGCVDVGAFCEAADQCCSGICTNSACRSHDVDVCQTGQSNVFCTDGVTDTSCRGGGGGKGLCATTTGSAGFCATDRQCVACKKDADCQTASTCGAGAACVICANCVDTGTACMASGAAGCA